MQELLQDRKGVTAVELALYAPIGVLMIAAAFAIQQGVLFKAKMEQAAKAATEYALANPPPPSSDMSDVRAVAGEIAGVPLEWISASMSCACSDTPVSCSVPCASSYDSKVFVNVSIEGTYYPSGVFAGWTDGFAIAGNSVVRLR